ncbi:MFS transporter [Xanthomonas citri]|nr:MFS transporter [Xanthomonas citri]
MNSSPEYARRSGPGAVLPLVLTTGVSLLATDLYLPSIPMLPELLDGSHRQAQSTLPAFFVTFAFAQLLYGALAERFGNLPVLLGAATLFILASALAAVSPDIEWLVAARAMQGAGAAAATAIVPAVIRQAYDEKGSVRMLSWLGICESVVPALGPLLGAGVLYLLGWRANFWLLVGLGVAGVALLLRNRTHYATSDRSVEPRRTVWRAIVPDYWRVISNRTFLGYAIGYSTAYGALMTFVGSAPFLLQYAYGHAPAAFGLVQIAMVALFMAGSLLAGRASESLGRHPTIAIGTGLLVLTALLLAGIGLHWLPSTAVVLTLAMLPSQFGLGLRFGVSMSAAIGSVPDRQASASAMTSFLCFAFAAAGNGAVAWLIDLGVVAVAWVFAVFALASLSASLTARWAADTTETLLRKDSAS